MILLLWLHLLLMHLHIRLVTHQHLLLVLLLEHELLLGPQIKRVLLIRLAYILLHNTLLLWSGAQAWGCYALAARRLLLVLESRG